MELTREEYIKLVEQIHTRSTSAQDAAYQILYVFYLHKNKDDYECRNRIENYAEFIRIHQLWLNTPVQNSPKGVGFNIKHEDINVGINKAIKYFNFLFKI